MPVIALIKFVQGLSTPPAGEALVGVLTTSVVVTNGDNSNVATWEWMVVDKPPGSTAVGSGLISTASSFSFSPDLRGGYHFQLLVRDVNGVESVDRRVFQVPEASGYIIPPFDALARALNFGGQLRGWAKPIEELLRYLLTLTPGGGAVIFDGGTTSQNARTDRAAGQSPIDNTKDGIVNLGSDVAGATLGVTGNYASSIGGDANQAAGDYSSLLGGSFNTATGDYSDAKGLKAVALRSTQSAHGIGEISAPGDGVQWSRYMLKGEMVGGVDVILLDEDGQEFYVEPGRAYAIKVTAVVNNVNGPALLQVRAIFIRTLLVFRPGNTSPTLTTVIDDNGGPSYSFVFESAVNVGVPDFLISVQPFPGDGLRFTFQDGDPDCNVRVACLLEWIEVGGAPDN